MKWVKEYFFGLGILRAGGGTTQDKWLTQKLTPIQNGF